MRKLKNERMEKRKKIYERKKARREIKNEVKKDENENK